MFTDKSLKLEKINKISYYINKNKPLMFLIVAIFCCYFVHKIIFWFCNIDLNLKVFNCSLENLYIYFGIFSIIMILILSIIKQKNIDIVGNTSMLLTTIKMLVCGIIVKTYLNQNSFKNTSEKWNFLTIFIIFLVLETVITIYLLNKKEI